MSQFKAHGALDKTYEVGIILKGLDGILELAGAALLYFISPHAINVVVRLLTQHELSQDPHDFLATHIMQSGQHLASGGTTFGVIYLLAHGLIKIVVVAALLKNRPWAYPFSLATLGAFVIYQVYRIIYQPTFGMIALTIFDLAVIWLVWREYRKQVLDPARRESY